MLIDILSDLHIDSYFKEGEMRKEEFYSLYDNIILDRKVSNKVGNTLIIAGDLGHYNSQNIKVIDWLKQRYYENIVLVLGNHEHFLVNKKMIEKYGSNSLNKIKEYKEMLSKKDGVYLLDGQVIEIDGVKIGGSMGWYSSAYLKHMYPYKSISKRSLNHQWRNSMIDNKYIYGLEDYDGFYAEEYKKLNNIKDKCDIMVTHMNPSFLENNLSKRFKGQQSNTFYCFNGHNLMKEGTMKYWVYGHTHDDKEYEYEKVNCICNPMGSSEESQMGRNVMIKQIKIV